MTDIQDKLNADDFLSLKAGDIVYEFEYGICHIGLLTGSPVMDSEWEYVRAPCLWYSRDSRHVGSIAINQKYGFYTNFYTYPAYVGSWPFYTLDDIRNFNPRTHIDEIDRIMSNE